MPRAPRSTRRLRWSAALAAGAVAAVLAAGGCQSIGATGQVVDRTDVVEDLVTRLVSAAELSYSADYQLPGGINATMVQAQGPRRLAYSYPGGKVTVTADATTRCSTARKPTTCTRAPAPTASFGAATVTVADGPTMISPDTAADVLSAVGIDAAAPVEQHDTTVAGRHAACVTVGEPAGTSGRLTACVTADGILGSFTGQVGGRTVDMTLTRYRDGADPSAFRLPPGAKVSDRRPATR